MPEVYALNFDLTPRAGSDPMAAISEALTEWVALRVPGLAPFDFREPASLHTPDGSILRWEPFHDGSRHLLDFTWRHFDATSRSVSWSTRVAYLDLSGRLSLAVQVANTGPDSSNPGALLTSRPRLLLNLLDHFTLRCDSHECRRDAEALAAEQIPSVVHYELFDPDRRAPIIFLTPRDGGTFVIPPAQLAAEFLSLAKVYCIPEPTDTFALTDVLGDRRLSCFGGALRVYFPGFNATSDPFGHPLFMRRRVESSADRYKLAQSLALLTTRRFRQSTDVLELRDLSAVKRDERLRSLIVDLERRRAVAKDQADWQALAEMAWDENKRISDELDDLRDRLRSAEAKSGWLESERRRLTVAAKEAGARPLEPEGLQVSTNSVKDAVEVVAELYDDCLLFLPTALESAVSSVYQRPDEVVTALGTLAQVAKQLAAGNLGTSLRDAFRALGQDYAPKLAENTPRRIRRQYAFSFRGEVYQCEEHLRLGGGYDPANCLRVYFTTKKRYEGKVVIGHVGDHLDVITTN